MKHAFFFLGAWALVGLAGCQPASGPMGAGPPKPPPPEVTVSEALVKNVIDYEDFPGRTEAVNTIEIRARVTGYIDKVHFLEGSLVKEGDLLFEIDPRPYQAEVNRAAGILLQAQGKYKRLEADYQRAQMLFQRQALSREEFDKIVGDYTDAQGSNEVAKANLEVAQLNLDWTKVKAPISGRISRRFIDPGNLVKADDTVLTTIVDLDPIYAYFDLDERTTLRFQRLLRESKTSWSLEGGARVLLGLSDEQGYPREGKVNFADNRVDSDTGTWRLRAVFSNHDQALSPGLFVRLRLPIGQPHDTVLVSEQALSTDQGQKFLYVVDEKNQVTYRRVKTARLHEGLRAISEGLKKGERVIVSGLQRARPGIEVTPKLVPMPVLGGNNGASP